MSAIWDIVDRWYNRVNKELDETELTEEEIEMKECY